MQKKIIYFAHANGFPVGCYQQLLDVLAVDFELSYIEKLAHNRAYPVDNNWQSSAAEMIDFIEQQCDRPVIGLGHSFGALITLQAAIKRPDLFSQIIMLDPPLMMGYGALIIYFAKLFKRMERITPAGQTSRRRQKWDSLDAAFGDLRGKKLFAGFSDEALMLYIKTATAEVENGARQLTYSVQVESDIFRTMPTNFECQRRKLPMPATLIYGTQTEVFKMNYGKRLQKLYGVKLTPSIGGHMLPLEFPLDTAASILKVINEQSHE